MQGFARAPQMDSVLPKSDPLVLFGNGGQAENRPLTGVLEQITSQVIQVMASATNATGFTVGCMAKSAARPGELTPS